jgi:hypothetical protein
MARIRISRGNIIKIRLVIILNRKGCEFSNNLDYYDNIGGKEVA